MHTELQTARWIVSNGQKTVGPVPMDLIIRGVEEGRIAHDCEVREVGWESFRPLFRVRELNAWRKQAIALPTETEITSEFLFLSDSAEEKMLLGLCGMAEACGASVALCHRVREPLDLPVTSYTYGATPGVLGLVVYERDPAMIAARSGVSVLGSPKAGAAERAIAARLCHDQERSLASVMMIPVMQGSKLSAMIELGREDHAFRKTDAKELAERARELMSQPS